MDGFLKPRCFETFGDLRQKEVINVCDGFRFGFVCDLELDLKCGTIIKLIIPACGRCFGLFGGGQQYRIPWDCIKRIGDDIILVEVDTCNVTFDV